MAGILTGFSLFAVSDANFNRWLPYGIEYMASNKFDACYAKPAEAG